MSAGIDTEITVKGQKDELYSFLKVLRKFETDNYKRYKSDRDCAYIEWVDLNNGNKAVRLEKMSDDEIREFIDLCDNGIAVTASGPYGRFGELGEVGLFEEMAEAAPFASFVGHISGFITGADVGLDAELENGKLTLSELYLPDDMQPDYDESDVESYEEELDNIREECTSTYTYTYDTASEKWEWEEWEDED